MTTLRAGTTPGGAPPWRRELTRHAGRLDWILVAAALGLSLLGTILVWSATLLASDGAPGRRQAVSLVLAVFVGYLVSRADLRRLRSWTAGLYLAAIASLLLTFSPLGLEVAGARAWLVLPGGFTLQPSEFAKLTVAMAVAAALSRPRSGRAKSRQASGSDPAQREATGRDLLVALLVTAPVLLLVLAQRDTGTALVIVGIVGAQLLVSGVALRYLAALSAVAVLAVVAIVSLGLLAQYQVDRFTAFLDPEADPLGIGHNTRQARIAIGAGGLLGRGIFGGSQTQGGLVPVNDSDFIFTVAAEELGLLGAVVLIGLLAVVCWRGIRIARSADSMFGRMLAAGMVAWFALQGFENIGMTLGITPVTGVTLPFVSYGGTSLIAAWAGIGLLQSVRLTGHGFR